MPDITLERSRLLTRVLEGAGKASPIERRAAFDNAGLSPPLAGLVRKVAGKASAVTDADVAAVKAVGLSEDQIFEIVICAALGQASRQYDAAVAALDRVERA
jgi:hypothetical protein